MSFAGRGRGFGSVSSGAGRGSFGMATESNGFGSFGSSNPAPQVEDDAWDEAPSTTSTNGFGKSSGGFESGKANGFGTSNGFGSSGNSGFGSSGNSGFGSSGNSGFGSSGNNGWGSGDGFGSKGGGGGGNRTCYKCGEEGHMSRECPQGGGGGGGGNRTCYKCGEEGHMSRECPQGGGGGRGGGGRGGGRSCHKCGEEGHMARECPSGGSGAGGFGSSSGGGFGSSSGGGFGGGSSGGGFGGGSSGGGFGGGSSGGGFGDGGFGGDSSSSGFGGGASTGGGSGCRNCGEDGHFARECPQPRKPQGACRTCNQEGHYSKECPQNEGKPAPEVYVPPEANDEESLFQSVQVGINFDKYDKIPVELSGENATGSIQTFAEAGLLETISRNVMKAKYFKPTPVQKYAIPAIMAGRDLMGCAQTGSGKTAAFLLPVLTGMIQRGLESSAFSPTQTPQALVVAPTRELVIQIYNECKKFSHGTIVRCVRLYGGTSTAHQMKDLSQGAHIVIATPGRLLDFLAREKLSVQKLQYLILDEADRMLDMGFEPDMRRLVETMNMPGKTERQTLMFSATFPVEIQKLAKDFLNDYLFLTIGTVGGANTDVTQTVLDVPTFEKRDKLLELLRAHPGQRTLVFVEQKRNADFLASMLSQSEFATTSIHGDRLQREREQALADFKSGVAPVLVATSVAARGLDIPGVDHVVNYDLPKEIDEYVHRIGRTGRCGNLGLATSFFDADANADVSRHLVNCLAEAHQTVPDFLERAADRGGRGGYGGGGSFSARDARGGGDAGAWDEQPSGMARAAAAEEEEESWD